LLGKKSIAFNAVYREICGNELNYDKLLDKLFLLVEPQFRNEERIVEHIFYLFLIDSRIPDYIRCIFCRIYESKLLLDKDRNIYDKNNKVIKLDNLTDILKRLFQSSDLIDIKTKVSAVKTFITKHTTFSSFVFSY